MVSINKNGVWIKETYGEDKRIIKSFYVSGGFVEINPEKSVLLAEEVFEISELNKSDIEKQIQGLENQNTEESKQQYLIAKSKIDAIEAKYYEKI